LGDSLKFLVERWSKECERKSMKFKSALRYEENFEEIIGAGADLFWVSINWHYEFDSVCEVIRSLPAEVRTVVGRKFATRNSPFR
jgi:hypothetical protein